MKKEIYILKYKTLIHLASSTNLSGRKSKMQYNYSNSNSPAYNNELNKGLRELKLPNIKDCHFAIIDEYDSEDKSAGFELEYFYSTIIKTTIVNRKFAAQINPSNAHRKEYMRKYYKNNLEKIRKRINVLVECPCGTKVQRYNLERHQLTKNHLNKITKNKRKKEIEKTVNNLQKELKKLMR